VRLGVEEREPPAVESSGGAERISAREYGGRIVAVGGLMRPGTRWQRVPADGLQWGR
jgi:hypothetical protein